MRNALTRWNPTTGNLVRDRLSRIFEDSFNDMLRPYEAETVSDRALLPPVDIKETEDALSLTVDLPGMTKDDVELTIENRVLTVSGERRFEDEQNNDKYHRIERGYGRFTRSFSLGREVAVDEVDAKFEHGVLQIVLPKIEESKPRKITIS